MSSALDNMYREIILDHYHSPRGKKPVERVDLKAEGFNPSCGDEITVQAAVDGSNIAGIHVDCRGCAISVASGSMLAEIVAGMTVDQAAQLAEEVKKMLKGENAVLPEERGDLDALQGVRQFPVRIKCALLAWMTLLEAIHRGQSGNSKTVAAVSTEDGKE